MDIRIFFLLALLSAQTISAGKLRTKRIRTTSTIDSVSNKGIRCMTGCTADNSNNFCYTRWGRWDYCEFQPNGPQYQYFTSMRRAQKPLCTSMCGYFGESYEWCFTGEGGSWDYCSRNSNKDCHDCSMTPPYGYECHTSYGSKKKVCSPDFISYKLFDDAADALENNAGVYHRLSGFKKCNRRYPRELTDDEIRDIDVEMFADQFAANYNTTTFSSGSNFPIRSAVTMTVPSHNQGVVRIPLAIRARLTRANINGAREAIPNFVEQQMIEMDRYPNDERGHLLAASLGGPSHDYNFAPQSTIVNRNYGGPSYWYEIEQNLRKALNEDTTAYIDWTVIVVYDDLLVTRRPLGFGLHFVEYAENGIVILDGGHMYFSNDPAGGCPM